MSFITQWDAVHTGTFYPSCQKNTKLTFLAEEDIWKSHYQSTLSSLNTWQILNILTKKPSSAVFGSKPVVGQSLSLYHLGMEPITVILLSRTS